MSNDRLRPAARKSVHTLVAAACATGIGSAFVLAGPVHALPGKPAAKPSIDQVKKQVDALYQQAEVASERYNSARAQLQASTTTLKALDSDFARQRAVVDKLRTEVASALVNQYQGGGLSTAAQVALSDDPKAFIDGLTAVAAYNSQRGEVMQQYSIELNRLQLRQAAVKQEAGQLAKTKQAMAADKAVIDKKAAAAKSQLNSLEASQRQELLGGNYTGPMPSVPASGRAAAAVKFALAQVGKAYVWGAAGPNAYDCSGLTMAAWGAAGVALPHNAAAQMALGRPVSESQLQPGDLVFYYSGPSHVGMYIGNGLIVNAENPSVGVKITGVNSMPYVGAVRPG